MTAEQHIIWLLLNRREEAPVIFSEIKPDMFPTQEYSRVYQQFYDRFIQISDQDFREVISPVQFSGQQWLPPYSQALKARLLSEWRESRARKIFRNAISDIREGREYRTTLNEINIVEDAFIKKQSDLSSLLDEIAGDYSKGDPKGFKTGLDRLDEMTERLQKGHLWVIAAYTNFGKTSMAMQMARNAVADGARVDFITLEMTDKQLLKKLIWIERCQELLSFDQAISSLADLPFTVTENLRTVKDIESHIKSNPAKADVFIVDYIQLMRSKNKLFEDATEAANTLQECAVAGGVCIIALSQITKESAKSGISFVMDTKNSGAIAESADVVLEIHRKRDNAVPHEDVVLFVKKNRHGRAGTIPTVFDNDRGIFLFNRVPLLS